MVVYKRASETLELEQILDLQQRNSIPVLSEDEKQREGFVTVAHTLELLNRMNEVCPHIIAKENNKVVGYTLCMHPRFGDEITILKPMFAEIATVLPESDKFIAMGQVCVEKAYRGKGVFRKLYAAMLTAVKPEFQCIVTEVDAKNTRSLQAHYAVGFKELKTYITGEKVWKIIILR